MLKTRGTINLTPVIKMGGVTWPSLGRAVYPTVPPLHTPNWSGRSVGGLCNVSVGRQSVSRFGQLWRQKLGHDQLGRLEARRRVRG